MNTSGSLVYSLQSNTGPFDQGNRVDVHEY